MRKPNTVSYKHFWSACDCCGATVICGNCGNNACNGGVGLQEDGSDCPACESAYQLMMREDDQPKHLISLSDWPKFPNPDSRFVKIK